MSKKERVMQAQLSSKEAQFNVLLRTCLAECADGRYGLFGQNAYADPDDRYWAWPEAKRLRGLAVEIRDARSLTGELNPMAEKLLELCRLRGPNVPGEPKLAAQFLSELQDQIHVG